MDVVAYANQDLIYSDLAAGRLDAALQDEVAASEGFLKQPAGKDYAFAGPSVKDKKYFGDGTGIGLVMPGRSIATRLLLPLIGASG